MTPNVTELQAEEYARHHLMASGIVRELKQNKLLIWTIRASKDKLLIAVDTTKNPNADLKTIERVIREFLAPLNRKIDLQPMGIDDNCCYGNCHGCLNGDPAAQKVWVLDA